MNGKITLITPPDIFENLNKSILFIHLSEQDQDVASKWLSNNSFDENFNFYIYDGQPDIPWLLHAVNLCQYKYIDFNGSNYVTQYLGSYLLAKNDFYYKIEDENIASIFSSINTNRISTIEKFLESIK